MEAVTVALRTEGHLLTAGEHHIAQRFLDLPSEAASLYARLLPRQPALFRLDRLSYAEIPDLPGAAHSLVESGLCWEAHRLAPPATLLTAWTVAELKELCAVQGLPRGGRRAELEARELEAETGALRARPAIAPGHRGLFKRLVRLFLHDHEGDLTRVVLARMGTWSFPTYAPTGGPGLFEDRRALLAYEGWMAAAWTAEAEARLALVPAALAHIEGRPPPDPVRGRMSGPRFAARLSMGAAQDLERAAQSEQAAAIYRRLLARGVLREEATVRLAMSLEATGRPGEGAALCAARRSEANPGTALQLERTGRRLARKAGEAWIPSPPLRAAPSRQLDLPGADEAGRRPLYQTSLGPQPVEEAVRLWLQDHGRRALHGEGAPWRRLFGLLFYEALFAPVPGMLPTPWLSAPLDLGTTGFVARRASLIEEILDEIQAGGAPDRLATALEAHATERIAGMGESSPPELLEAMVQGLPGPALAVILGHLARHWRHGARGLPDLCVLPGPAVDLPRALPARLREELILVEIKGPGDSLRDDQRVWMDRLLAAGVRVELWQVRRDPPPGLAPRGPTPSEPP